MKIEFIADGVQDAPVMLIHSGTPQFTSVLRDACLSLSNSTDDSVALHDLEGIECEGITITAQAAKRSAGMVQIGPNSFQWSLTPLWWENVTGLLEPFCESMFNGHQYLDNKGEITVIISTNRAW